MNCENAFKHTLMLHTLKIDYNTTTITPMDYSKKTRQELIFLCKEKKIKGYSGMKKEDIYKLLSDSQPTNTPTEDLSDSQPTNQIIPLRQDVIHGDTIQILPTLEADSAQIIIADPPYNIGKDFGNDSDKQPMDEYLLWCEQWIKECIRVLKPNGTMFIYGLVKYLLLFFLKFPIL